MRLCHLVCCAVLRINNVEAMLMQRTAYVIYIINFLYTYYWTWMFIVQSSPVDRHIEPFIHSIVSKRNGMEFKHCNCLSVALFPLQMWCFNISLHFFQLFNHWCLKHVCKISSVTWFTRGTLIVQQAGGLTFRILSLCFSQY